MRHIFLFSIFSLIANSVFTQKTFQYKDYDFCAIDASAHHSTDTLIYYSNFSFDEGYTTLLSSIDSSGKIERLVVDSTLQSRKSKIFEVGKDSLIFFYYNVFTIDGMPLFETFEVTLFNGVFSRIEKNFDPNLYVGDLDIDPEELNYTIIDNNTPRLLKYAPSGILVNEKSLPHADQVFI